jgi:hypothetical protein
MSEAERFRCRGGYGINGCRLIATLFAVVVVMIVDGCSAGELESARTATTPYALGTNGLSLNGLVANGLRMNGLRMNGLRMNGLRMNGLKVQKFSINDLSTAESDAVMSYVVGCALDATQEVTLFDASTGMTYTWHGDLGLAPKWATGALNPTDQQRVSACLLALTNPSAHVLVSLRGPYPGLATTLDETRDFSVVEGAFYGDLFAEPAILRGCYTRPDTPIDRRSCTLIGSPNACGIDVVGSCGTVCLLEDLGAGTFGDCEGWNEVITTFVTDTGTFLPPVPPEPAPVPPPSY